MGQGPMTTISTRSTTSALVFLLGAAVFLNYVDRGAIAVGWAGMAVSLLFIVFSPVPRVRRAADWVAAHRA